MKSPITITEALVFGWNKIKSQPLIIITTALVFGILSAAFGDVKQGNFVVFFGLLNVIVSHLASYTFINMSLALYRGETLSVKSLFEVDMPLFGRYLMVSIATTLIIIIGYIFFIIPGIYAAIMLAFTGVILLSEKTEFVETFKESRNIVRGHAWFIVKFSLALLIINIGGLLLFGVGLLVTVPLSVFAKTYVYKKLKDALTPVVIEPVQTPTTTPVV